MSVGEADLEVVILALGDLEISVRRRSRPRAAADPEADEGFVLAEPEATREPQACLRVSGQPSPPSFRLAAGAAGKAALLPVRAFEVGSEVGWFRGRAHYSCQ